MAVPALLTSYVDIHISDLGLRLTFGDPAAGGYHSSVFLPIQHVPQFEKKYKEVMTKYLEAVEKAQQPKTRTEAIKRRKEK